MSKSKKILYISTFSILIILIVCTVLSKFISEAIMPTVEVINPVSMDMDFMPTDAYNDVYDRVIPVSAIIPGAFNQKHVYVVRQRKGLFGDENYVILLEVQIIDSNDIYAALGGWNVMAFDDVVISSSRVLTAREVVKVINK